MPQPSPGPNFPSRMPTPKPGQLHVYDANGKIMRTVSFGQRTDPGYFKKLITQIRAHNQPIQMGLAVSGFGLAGVALLSASVVNLGNPFLFYDRRETWKEMHDTLKGSAWDVWITFFHEVSPNWKGHAVDTLQQYLRFKLIGMFDQLGAVAKDMSGTMHNQYKEVLGYDMSAAALWAMSAPVFTALTKMSAHPVGRVALMAQAGVFLTAAGNLLKQFADVYNKYESDLNDLQLKINDLEGLFYKMGNPALGTRDLHFDQSVSEVENWRPATAEGAK
ncbi:hypothetical protein ACBI99_34555 [Nonomuraea sp. ATR24]|uniref:hypothetical protein n=1 Tax=Nonomuraea sp. ATR24 TaxID=1676744 RepID=UPI0035BFED6D